MLQIKNFIAALKITWLRRQILQPNCTWNILLNIDLENVYTRGDNYANIKSETVKNPFWKDLLKSWKIFCKSVKIQTLEDMLYSPLWCNSNFQHGQYIYFKDWYNKGIRNVIDLLDTDGNFYQFHQLQELYNIHGTFLDYASLLRKILAQWKQNINENNVLCQALKPNVSRNCYINFLGKDKQVAQRATIAHLSPMCQGQISFQKIRTHPSFNACSCYMKVSKGSNQKQQRKSGNIIFPVISLWGYFLDAQRQLTP